MGPFKPMTETFPRWALLTFLTASGVSCLLEDRSLASFPFLRCLSCLLCLEWHLTSLPLPARLAGLLCVWGYRSLTSLVLLCTSALLTGIFHSTYSIHPVPNRSLTGDGHTDSSEHMSPGEADIFIQADSQRALQFKSRTPALTDWKGDCSRPGVNITAGPEPQRAWRLWKQKDKTRWRPLTGEKKLKRSWRVASPQEKKDPSALFHPPEDLCSNITI